MNRRSFMMTAAKLAGPVLAALTLDRPGPAGADGFRGGLPEAYGPRFRDRPGARRLARSLGARSWVHHWNAVAIDASGLDHTPVAPGEQRVFGENLGPGRASRAMAIVHIAMFDVVNAIAGGYQSYAALAPARDGTSMRAAIAQAAHDTLAALYPSQRASFAEELDDDLDRIPDRTARARGMALGQEAAAAILSLRIDDGSQRPEPRVGVEFITGNEPGQWRQDPISLVPIALGAHWGEVRPFVLSSPDQFRVPPPPALTSARYTAAYDEAKRLGGDNIVTPTERTPEQTVIGTYWAYDGTPSLCAPPRLYNQIAVLIADQMRSDLVALARLLALVNVAMADAGIAIWESKYRYAFWRPVTGIRESDQGAGPMGLGDGNAATIGDPTFTPLGAPASNLDGPNFTPPFPTYPSGHAGFGGALFQVLRRFYRTDRVAFTFVSDEFNGTIRARSAYSCRARSRRYPTPKRRTVRAGSIWAFTGRSTRRRASRSAGTWPTPCSSRHSYRCVGATSLTEAGG